MQNRQALPPQVSAIIAQIDALKKNEALSIEYFTDLKNFSYSRLSAIHQYQNQQHSFAKWVHLNGRQDILDWLYAHANDPSVNNNYFLLHWAVLCRQPESVINTLATFKRTNYSYSVYYRNNDPYFTKQNNMTPLHLAVTEGNLEMVRTLISATNNPVACKPGTTSPLHIAVSTNNPEMVELLLELNAQLEHPNEQGQTPLHLAMSSGHPDIIAALVAAGANILAPDSNGNTPMHDVMQKGDDAQTYFELLHPKDLSWTNATNNISMTTFALAAANNQFTLIDNGLAQQVIHANHADADICIQPTTLSQALRAAAKNGHSDIVEILLPYIENGNDECADKPGSALSMAAHGNHIDTVRALLRRQLLNYIVERDDGPDFKKHTYFFVKKGAGYSKEKKIAAARALLEVVNCQAAVESLQAHHGPLHNKSLHGIFNLVDKFILQGYRPPAESTIDPSLVSVTAPASNGGSSHSSSNDRQTSEFEYLETAGHCCEATACLCSFATNNGRGGACNIM